MCAPPDARAWTGPAWTTLGPAADHQPGAGSAGARDRISFNDRSGDRLREWLALDREIFYDESRVAIVPIGLCYPGRATRSLSG